jgi:hypothetical protein
MKLPNLKDVDYRKIIALAVLILALSFAVLMLSDRFSKIEVLGVKLETKTEQTESPTAAPDTQEKRRWNPPMRQQNSRDVPRNR